jgi:hypothetical protein
MTWAYVGLALFGLVPVIVKAVLIYRARHAPPLTDEEIRKWDEAVRGP